MDSASSFGILGAPRKYQCCRLESPVVEVPKVSTTQHLYTGWREHSCSCGCHAEPERHRGRATGPYVRRAWHLLP